MHNRFEKLQYYSDMSAYGLIVVKEDDTHTHSVQRNTNIVASQEDQPGTSKGRAEYLECP